MNTYTVENASARFQARYWAATIQICDETQEQYVNENAGIARSYTTPASDNDVFIRWGYVEDKDKMFDGKHVHVHLSVINNLTKLRKRITKCAAKQRLVSALRMNGWNLEEIPYLAPLKDRLAYETYADKTVAVSESAQWNNGGITNVAYLRRVVEEVGTDMYSIYRKIQDETKLPLQKIVSQRAGIQAYLDIQKSVSTESIRRQVQQKNHTGVHTIVQNIKYWTDLELLPQKRLEFLCTLLYMSTVDRHQDDGIKAPLLWSVKEGTGKSTTIKVIPSSMRKIMVTDAGGVGANDFRVSENVFVLDDINIREITEEKRGIIWALATGGTAAVKVHSSSRKIDPKWVIGSSNEDIYTAIMDMGEGTKREKTAVRGLRSRFQPIEFRREFRGLDTEINIQLDDNARMDLLVEVMTEISRFVEDYKKLYQKNVMHALYMVEACRVLQAEHPQHKLFATTGFKEVCSR